MIFISLSAEQVVGSPGIDSVVALNFDILEFETPRGRSAKKNRDPYTTPRDFDIPDRRHVHRQNVKTLDVEVEDARVLPRPNGKPAHTNDILAYLGLAEGEERNSVLRKYGNGNPADGIPTIRDTHERLVALNFPQYVKGTPDQAREISYVASLLHIAGLDITNTQILNYLSMKREVVTALLNSYLRIGRRATEELLVNYPPEQDLGVFVAVSDSIHRNGPEMTYAVAQRYEVNALPLIVNGVGREGSPIKPIIPFDYGGPEGSVTPVAEKKKRSKHGDVNHNHHGRMQNHQNRRHMQVVASFVQYTPQQATTPYRASNTAH